MIGTLQPGGMTSEEPLAHDGEECLVILKGALRVEFPAEPEGIEGRGQPLLRKLGSPPAREPPQEDMSILSDHHAAEI